MPDIICLKQDGIIVQLIWTSILIIASIHSVGRLQVHSVDFVDIWKCAVQAILLQLATIISATVPWEIDR